MASPRAGLQLLPIFAPTNNCASVLTDGERVHQTIQEKLRLLHPGVLTVKTVKNNRHHHHNWVLFKQKKEVETASTNSSLLVPHGGNGAPYNQYRCDHYDDDDGGDDHDDDHDDGVESQII